MYHYRWSFAPDIARAAALLPRWARPGVPASQAVEQGRSFSDRQIGRLRVVGSNGSTAPIIEESYRRALALLDTHLGGSRFVMGGRPGASDFGIFGQLTQLAAFDPTPAAIALERAPRVVAWVDVVEDLSGLEPAAGDWTSREGVPDTLRALLAEVGRVYAPFLLANAEALRRGSERVECTIDGRAWVQQPFPYQGKCLQALRASYAALAPADHGAVDGLLAGTGCERLLAGID
jgi:hypothetical protein